MGKAKKRGFNLKDKITSYNITRKDAIIAVIEKKQNNEDTSKLMSLFGLTTEELLEAGASYEDIMQ